MLYCLRKTCPSPNPHFCFLSRVSFIIIYVTDNFDFNCLGLLTIGFIAERKKVLTYFSPAFVICDSKQEIMNMKNQQNVSVVNYLNLVSGRNKVKVNLSYINILIFPAKHYQEYHHILFPHQVHTLIFECETERVTEKKTRRNSDKSLQQSCY